MRSNTAALCSKVNNPAQYTICCANSSLYTPLPKHSSRGKTPSFAVRTVVIVSLNSCLACARHHVPPSLTFMMHPPPALLTQHFSCRPFALLVAQPFEHHPFHFLPALKCQLHYFSHPHPLDCPPFASIFSIAPSASANNLS